MIWTQQNMLSFAIPYTVEVENRLSHEVMKYPKGFCPEG